MAKYKFYLLRQCYPLIRYFMCRMNADNTQMYLLCVAKIRDCLSLNSRHIKSTAGMYGGGLRPGTLQTWEDKDSTSPGRTEVITVFV